MNRLTLGAAWAAALHESVSAQEWLATGFWAGLAVLLGLAAVAGLLVGARLLARRGAACTRPCPGCGYFLNPSREKLCPQCGRPAERPPDVRDAR